MIRKRSRKQLQERIDSLTSKTPQRESRVPEDFSDYEQALRETWNHCDDLKIAVFRIGVSQVLVCWLDGLVDRHAMQVGILDRLTAVELAVDGISHLEPLLVGAPIVYCDTMGVVHRRISDGHVVVYLGGMHQALSIDLTNLPGRAVESSQNEPSIEGPQEALVETLNMNIAMVRKRLKSPRFKVETRRIGEVTDTPVAVLYVEGIVDPKLVVEIRERLSRIQIDSILDVNYVREMIRDAPWSLFPTTESTERPDKITSAMLQGRIAILVHGATHALILPAVFVQYLIAAEDSYSNFYLATGIRILRHIMFWISVVLPALYVSLLSYHQDLIPTPLLISLEGQHEGIPFPTYVEAFLMQFFFEALREAGQRLPRAVGQSVSIVGGLVIGDAAVNAGIVSPGMVIVVASTGIASFTIASYTLVNTSRVLQFCFLAAAALLGLYGVVLLGIIVITHMVSIRSLGVPYMAPYAPLSFPEMKDTILRAPWWLMKTRPQIFSPTDAVRNKTPEPGSETGD
ncbi:spore germination protein [Alicyclobacillus mengziensis]|uniref:spore germination protein n=1 Tax=Alicyclobacillus mengziensis TaxID=2931921 RepID=UPI002011581D|nr:spore germination protein [Alicyclobacillus mengziensis]